jgi:glycosyltransferase involved in cell wall biosynthesis
MRDVLFLSYFFPPMGGGAVLRALKFVKYLPVFGWRPLVIAGARGYPASDPSLLEEIPDGAAVTWAGPRRDFGQGEQVAASRRPLRTDVTSRLARYAATKLSRFVSFPDRYAWFAGPARRAARPLLERHRPELVFSTAPPFTSHVVAAGLAREAGVPLVLDYRDAWTDNPFATFPTPFHRRRARRLEDELLAAANAVTAVTSGMAETFEGRAAGRYTVKLIPNGYDEEDFSGAAPPADGPFTVAYAGQFYPGRMPWPFLEAASAFVRARRLGPEDFRVSFLGHIGRRVFAAAAKFPVRVEGTGLLRHREAVGRIRAADVNLLIIGSFAGAGTTLTGKVFEYLRGGRPILALVPPEGEAAALVREFDAGVVVPPEDVAGIEAALARLYDERVRGPLPAPAGLVRFERRTLTSELAALFDDVAGK